MEKFAKCVLKFRIPIIAISTVLTLFFGYQLRKIRIESDFAKYLKQSAPEVKIFNYIGEKYGGNEIVLVAIETNDIFTYNNLKLIAKLSDTYANLKGVASVTSLTNIIDIRKSEGGLEVTNLIDENNIPSDPGSLKRLKQYVLEKDMYRGKIVSADGRIALIVARLGETKDRIKIAREIKKITLKETHGKDVKVYFSGLPMQMIEVNQIVLRDMLRLIPIVSLVVMMVLFLGLHNLRGVILPLLTVALSVIWSIGLMATVGRPLSIISNIMPVLLIAIGTAYTIHFISRYREEFKNGERKESLIRTFKGVGIPIILSGLTTIAGFISFAGAYLVSVTDFGIFSAFGVFVALLLSLTLIPAILSFMSPPAARFRHLEEGSKLMEKIVEPVAESLVRHAKTILFASFIIMLLGIAGALRISTSVNILDYFPKNSEIRHSEDIFQKYFGGSIPVQILIRGDLKNPVVLGEMFRLEKYIRQLKTIDNPQSLASLISEENYVMNGIRNVPSNREGVTNLLFMLEGQDILSQLVAPEYNEGIVQARFSHPETKYIVSTIDSIENFINHDLLREAVLVKRQNIPSNIVPKVDSILISRASSEIVWDTRYRLSESVNQDKISEIIKRNLKSTTNLSGESLKKLRSAIFDYFYNEFDIELSESRTEKITDELLNKIETLNYDSFSKILNENVNGLSEDITKDAYSYISSLVTGARNSQLVNTLADSICAFINSSTKCSSSDPLVPEKLREDIVGDLYTLVAPQVYLPPGLIKGETVKFTAINNGFLKIYGKFHENLLKSQEQSFALAFALVTILVAFQLSSVLGGLIGIYPILLVVAFTFFIMGFAGVPLDNATMMIAAIVIGIGIDYVIHFTSRFKKELSMTDDPNLALRNTLLTTGRAIYLNAFTVGLGFLVLIFAELIPLRTFGWLVALTMLLSSLFATTVLPALIILGRKYFIKGGVKR